MCIPLSPRLAAGPAPGWHIEYIDVKDEVMDQTFRFPCDRWLAKNEDDGQIMRELPCANNDKLDFNEKTSKTGTSQRHAKVLSDQGTNKRLKTIKGN
jgi:hypothetical protein